MRTVRSCAIPVGTRFIQAGTNHLRYGPTVPEDRAMSSNTSLGEALDIGATQFCCCAGVDDIEVISGLVQPKLSPHVVAARYASIFRDKA